MRDLWLVNPFFYEKDRDGNDQIIQNKYLYIVTEFNSEGYPTEDCHWRFYIGDDGRAYHDGTTKLRPMHPHDYYFFVSPDKYDNPENIIKEEYCTELIRVSHLPRQKVKLNRTFFLLQIYPRCSENLFHEENGTTKIKDILPEFKERDNCTDYDKAVKGIEYNFYVDLKPNTASAKRKFSVYIELVKNHNSDELPILYKNENFNTNNTIQVSKISGHEDCKFFHNNSFTTDPIDVPLNNEGIATFIIAHDFKNNIESDKEVLFRASIKSDNEVNENSSFDIKINLTRNEDTNENDILGSRDDHTSCNGFLVKEFSSSSVKMTKCDYLENTLQLIMLYDLDKRGNSWGDKTNYINGLYGNETFESLKEYISSFKNKIFARTSGNKEAWQSLGIYESLKEYLNNEYINWNYSEGLIIDKKLLIGENNDNSNIDQIDGLLEVYEYNKKNIRKNTTDYMAVNCKDNQWGGHNDFGAIFQGHNESTANWYELLTKDNESDEIVGEPIEHTEGASKPEDRAPEIRYCIRRRHKGLDYNPDGDDPHLISPAFTRVRWRDVSSRNSNSIRFGMEVIGVGRYFQVLHLNKDDDIVKGTIFCTDDRIANYPTVDDVGGAHFHLEKWKVKRLPGSTQILHPNTDQPPEKDINFYFSSYTKLENAEDGLARWRRDRHYNCVQPEDKYEGDYD